MFVCSGLYVFVYLCSVIMYPLLVMVNLDLSVELV
jgi:hypothetical protein